MTPPPLLEHDYIGLSEAAYAAGGMAQCAPPVTLNLKETELRLGLPGSSSPDRGNFNLEFVPSKSLVSAGAKRKDEKDVADGREKKAPSPPAPKAQAVGWPPIRSYRKNTMATTQAKNKEEEVNQGAGCLYVKVSMDGAPYLRKVDLTTYKNYKELSLSLEKMFSGFTIGKDGLSECHKTDALAESEYVLTYEDNDEDWMLVGDVPWEMFTGSCRRLRIMRGSDAIGFAPRVSGKFKAQS